MIPAVFGLVAGLVLGSFIAALTLRWPQGRSVARGRSGCDACGAVLAARDLVPVVSFVMLRGRCRQCGAVIAPRHLWVELAAGSIGAVALGLHPGLVGVAGAVFGWGLLALAILDVEHFWLPDRLTLPLLALGLLVGLWFEPSVVERAVGAAAGFLALAAIAAGYKLVTGRTGMGGGDPKLLAAIGAWLGWQVLPLVVLLAAGLGLVLAGVAAMRGQDVSRLSRVPLGALLAVAAWPVWLVLPAGLSGVESLAMFLP